MKCRVLVLMISAVMLISGAVSAYSNDSKTQLKAEALLKAELAPVKSGLLWQVYGTKADESGHLPIIFVSQQSQLSTHLPPGRYVVTVAYGLAAVSQTIDIGHNPVTMTLILDAGALRFASRLSTGQTINPDRIHNMIFHDSLSEPMVDDARPDNYYRLPEGAYRIESFYGDVNALSTATVEVEAGKLSDTVIRHRARPITFKLVRSPGGRAQVNVSWRVVNVAGETIAERDSAIAKVILAEGRYQIIAQHESKRYQSAFVVTPGLETTVEVPMTNNRL